MIKLPSLSLSFGFGFSSPVGIHSDESPIRLWQTKMFCRINAGQMDLINVVYRIKQCIAYIHNIDRMALPTMYTMRYMCLCLSRAYFVLTLSMTEAKQFLLLLSIWHYLLVCLRLGASATHGCVRLVSCIMFNDCETDMAAMR